MSGGRKDLLRCTHVPCVSLLQTSHASSSPSPQQHTGSSSPSVLVVGQDSVTPPTQPANQTQQQTHLSKCEAASHMATPPVQVKEECRRDNDAEDTCMDTHQEEGEELDISFDSQFPDLISDLITEEADPVTAQPATVPAPSPAVYPAGVRYMVPPQPSPSSSFLPFPHPLPSSSRLASITDFSPEWSYPEVIDH